MVVCVGCLMHTTFPGSALGASMAPAPALTASAAPDVEVAPQPASPPDAPRAVGRIAENMNWNGGPWSIARPDEQEVSPAGRQQNCTMRVAISTGWITPVYPGTSITFTARAEGGIGPYVYQWMEDGVDIPDATESSYTVGKSADQSHAYNCRMSDSTGICDNITGAAVTATWSEGMHEAIGTRDPGCTPAPSTPPVITGITDVNACAASGIQVNYTSGSMTCGAQSAVYNSTYKAPACATNGLSCDSGASLLKCAHTLETNTPNTLNSSCTDGYGETGCDTGQFESVDQISLATNDGSCLEAGKAVTITAKFYCYSATLDYVGVYYTTAVPGSLDAVWTAVGGPALCGATGFVTKTYTTTLSGSATVQAVRAQIVYYFPPSAACYATTYSDHDDLVFPVITHNLLKDGLTVVTGYPSGATYNPGDTSTHTYVVQATNGTCGANSAGVPGTDMDSGSNAPAAPTVTDVSACALSGVSIAWGALSGATGYDLYVDSAITVTGVTSPYVYTPGNSSSHNYQVRAKYPSCTSAWSTGTAGSDANNTPGAPAITGIADINPALMNGIRIYYNAGAGAASHDLFKDGLPAVTGYVSGATYLPGNTSAHSYVVRAVNGACYADSAPMIGTDAAGGPPGEAAPGDTSSDAQTWSSKTTMGWPAVSGATYYTVYRGVLADLPNLLTGADDSCTLYTGPFTTVTDASDPYLVPGHLYWYLVTAGNDAGEGPAGNATAGPRIVNSTGSCPP